MTHSIVIIDDHEIAHSALRLLIADRDDLSLEKCFRTAASALEYLSQASPDIVILDLDLPDSSGVKVLEDIRERLGFAVLVLSGTSRVITWQKCREAGATAMVSKGDRVDETLAAIDSLLAGKPYFSPGVVALLGDESGAEMMALSNRQEEILQMVTEGLSNKEIAYKLGIAQPTVSFHLRELSRKLGADHPRQLVARAKSAGYL